MSHAVIVYRMHFFATRGEETGEGVIDRILHEVIASGRPVLGEWSGPFAARTRTGNW